MPTNLPEDTPGSGPTEEESTAEEDSLTSRDLEDESWIPCDLCDTLVRFCDYEAHAEECRPPPPPQSSMESLYRTAFQIQWNHDANRDEDDDSDSDSDEDSDEEEEGVRVRVVEPDTTLTDRLPALMMHIVGAAAAGSRMGEYESNLLMAEAIGGVAVSVPASSFDEVIPRATDAQILAAAPDEACPICQDTISGIVGAGGTVLRTSACGHLFCRPCIQTWLSSSTRCPLCMLDIEL